VDDLTTVAEKETDAGKELVAKLIWPHGRRNILIKTMTGSRLFEACESLGGEKNIRTKQDLPPIDQSLGRKIPRLFLYFRARRHHPPDLF
jgi:hypothetical protein